MLHPAQVHGDRDFGIRDDGGMLETPVMIGIVSICIGFVFFMLAATGTRSKWDKKVTITLFAVAIVFMTIIPVVGAVGFAA